jgi:hypothetical protein
MVAQKELCCQNILLFDKMIQKTFLSSPMKPKRSSNISLFSRVQHEWMWVKGLVDSSILKSR